MIKYLIRRIVNWHLTGIFLNFGKTSKKNFVDKHQIFIFVIGSGFLKMKEKSDEAVIFIIFNTFQLSKVSTTESIKSAKPSV